MAVKPEDSLTRARALEEEPGIRPVGKKPEEVSSPMRVLEEEARVEQGSGAQSTVEEGLTSSSPLFGLYKAIEEVGMSEVNFRNALKTQIDRVAGEPELEGLLQPHRDIMRATSSFTSEDELKAMFDEGKPGAAIEAVCEDLERHIDMTQSSFSDAVANMQELRSAALQLGIANIGDLAILPVQRMPRYDILVGAIVKEAQNYNKKNPGNPLDTQFLNRLTALHDKVKAATRSINERLANIDAKQGRKNFFGDDAEMVALFDELGIAIPKAVEAKSAEAKDIARNIRRGAPRDSLTKLLKQHGIVGDAAEIKQKYYFSQLDPKIRESVRKEQSTIHSEKGGVASRLFRGKSATLHMIDELNKAVKTGEKAKVASCLEALGVSKNNKLDLAQKLIGLGHSDDLAAGRKSEGPPSRENPGSDRPRM